MPFASRAADRSALWLGIASALALLGGRRGRRAALRGALAIGVASGTVNGPLKMLAGRPRPDLGRVPQARALVRRPRSFSFPSGHSASAFAFATAVGAELPILVAPLAVLAGAVAYSRIHSRVHYPSDVLAGASLGVLAGLASGPLVAAILGLGPSARAQSTESGARRRVRDRVLLVTNGNAGRAARGLERARRALREHGFELLEEMPVAQVARLPELLAAHGTSPPLVLAAGGDGTVGAVANHLAHTGAVLGVLPLGTSNDFARSLGIPMDIPDAVALLSRGRVLTIDLGRVVVPGQAPLHFVHAATAGLNVSFAKLATRASVRRRFGRLTYVIAAARTLRDYRPFRCEISYEGRRERIELVHLSVINAPVFGGFLGMRLSGSRPDDRLLDVLAVEEVPVRRMLLAALHQLLRLKRPLKGIHAFQVSRMRIHADEPVELALDGEVLAVIPAAIEVADEALRVVSPIEFEDGGG
jgi:YegS/Rv2252/BmrU family lipid kinase